MPNDITEGKTVSSRSSVVQVRVRPDAEFHMLVGGPYSQGGEEHRYGHTAVRIRLPRKDVVYDFGRYGRVTGDFGAEGDGILRVWDDFEKYIAGENALGRETVGFMYRLFSRHTLPAIRLFDSLIDSGERQPAKERGRSWLKVYKLQRRYHALGPNCTTLSLDAASSIWPEYEVGSQDHVDPEAVLTFTERAALRLVGVPNRIFLPANLQSFLESNPPIRVDEIGRYP